MLRPRSSAARCRAVSSRARCAIPPISVARVGHVREATAADVEAALAATTAAAPAWNDTPPAARAEILEKAAALIEDDRAVLMALAIREGGKSVRDALAEVREAVDLCRYYAAHARADFVPRALPGVTGEDNTLALAGRGVFACISPWNFPLAIFTGQVAAALAAGNAVIAKPAEQTPLIAARAVGHLHAAGVPGRRACPAAGRRRGRRAHGWWRTRASPASPSPARPRPPRRSTARLPGATGRSCR